ncbi:MAG TPA: hypothetical protein VJ860_02985 [Polyangia bacterium]|jgi:hypothetical protein|nr:hypothetical protein [Polyangia bacterium]
MTSQFRLCLLALVLLALPGCSKKDGVPNDPRNNPNDPRNNPGGGGSNPVLRANIGIDLGQVSSFVALRGASSSGQALRLEVYRAPDTDPVSPDGGMTSPSPRLLALTLSGEVLEVSLVEEGNPQAAGNVVEQPGVRAIFPTHTWVLFSTPGFGLNVQPGDGGASNDGGPAQISCGIIAARRADGALFCAPLYVNNGWEGTDTNNSIFSNGAGDVVYTMAYVAGAQGMVAPDSERLYKITLPDKGGPIATPALDFPIFMLQTFRVNGTGDLFVNYPASAMDPVGTSKIIPLDGSSAFTVPGQHNNYAIAGQFGAADQDTFYVGEGGGVVEPQVHVVSKSGASFVDTLFTLNMVDAWSFQGLSRLSDGIYMFSNALKELARVIVDGVVQIDPTRRTLSGVDRIVGQGSNTVASGTGEWVFIAASGTGYKFVREDGVNPQTDIPFDPDIDVRSFTVAADGAIDFLGIRTTTQEKIHGKVASRADTVTITSAGVLDPARVIAFTQINN